MDDGRTPDHGYTIAHLVSSGELRRGNAAGVFLTSDFITMNLTRSNSLVPVKCRRALTLQIQTERV